ncbi:hypothetical protein B0H14DRAFT_2623284 [Mycena olivaceomarginata]|nr:hypothetical protein B0H14DRAFT_2623284 [Mycena olivaceomarginata]
MSRLYLTAFLAFLCAVATASTQLTGQHHPPPPTKHCTVQKNRNGADDSANILKAFTDCATNSIITFLPTNYSAFTPITLAGLTDAVEVDYRTMLDNVVIHLNGNLVLPNNITKVQQEINVTTNQPSTYATPWFYFHGNGTDFSLKGNNVQLIGSTDFEWGRFYGFGNHWWDLGVRLTNINTDAQATTGDIQRDEWRVLSLDESLMRNLKVIKPVAWGWNLPGTNLRVENHYVDAKPDNGTRWNTVLMGAGARVSPLNTSRAGRGGNGFADNVTWEDITLVKRFDRYLSDAKRSLEESIRVWDHRRTPQATAAPHISNFHYKNFKGSLNANWTDGMCWNFVQGGDATQSIIFDLYPGTALNISVGKIAVHPFEKPAKDTTVICDPATLVPGEQATLGFNCTRGPYVPTRIVKQQPVGCNERIFERKKSSKMMM